jgi:uncharacterized protein (TIRG00374 family)
MGTAEGPKLVMKIGIVQRIPKQISIEKSGRILLTSGVTVLCTYLVLKNIDFNELFKIIYSANLQLMVLSLVSFSAVYLVLAWEWQVLLKSLNIEYNFWQVVKLYLISFAARFFLPIALGAYVPLLYLRRDGQSTGKSAFSILLFTIIQLIPAFIFSTIAVFAFPSLLGFQSLGLFSILVILLLSGLTFIFFSFRNRLPISVHSFLSRFFDRWSKNLQNNGVTFNSAFQIFNQLSKRRLIFAVSLSFLAASLNCFVFYILALSIHTKLSVWDIFASLSIVTVVVMLPISIGGIGVREGTLVILFTLLGESPETAVALSLLLLVKNLLWRLLGIIVWFRYQLHLSR